MREGPVMTTASFAPVYPTMSCPGISGQVYPENDEPIFENIPSELKNLEQWVLWKKEERGGNLTKIPYDPKTWSKASSTDRGTWGSYDQAITAYRKGDFQGIGFVFSGEDDIIGIDWDHVRDPYTGAWDEMALEEIRNIGSYAEISPSGTGAHVIVRGTIPGDRKRSGNREMYSHSRYFTVTGRHIPETPLSVEKANPGSIEAVYNAMVGGQGVTESEHGATDETDEIPDDEILRMCQNAANRRKFNALWSGRWSEYPSQSEADSALCCILAFYTRNPIQIDRISRKSKLYREKWDEMRGKMTYGMQTIQHALETQKEHYKNQKGIGTPETKEHREFALTDLGNKDRMLGTYGDQIRYCTKTRRWYIWNGQIWKPDETDFIMILASKVARAIYHEAAMQNSDHQRGQIVQWGRTSESLPRQVAMVKTTEPHVAITLEELDNNPNLFNCRNGTLELDTLTFREHRRDDMLTRWADVEYDPDATCPLWEKHLNLVFGGDDAFIRDFQMICGYNLLYDNPEQIFFILWGSGKNGKSKTVEVLSSIMGDYAINISPETLMAKNNSGPRSDLVRIMGTRMATSCEGDEGCQLGEGTIKQLTGDEYIVARRLYENEIQFRPLAKIWFATNHKPVIRGSDTGIWTGMVGPLHGYDPGE